MFLNVPSERLELCTGGSCRSISRGGLLRSTSFKVDDAPRHGLPLAWARSWAALGAASTSDVAERATFHSHWLEEAEALGAAFERAQSRIAEVAAQLASLAFDHTLGVAFHARSADFAAWSGVALQAALRVAALLAARAALAATRLALGGAVDLAAIVAALERARIWLAAQPKDGALVATIHGARAIPELAMKTWAPCIATGWRASVTASGAHGAE